ncbi:GTP 3',8-cyclase MoaA [Dehalogenimonas formicexedens]|nr:GTP 3',8-cyclase MoaA [Dehalogenimonas formicexedens]
MPDYSNNFGLQSLTAPAASQANASRCPTELYDGHNRRIDYLRISVTDRCNLSCVYCGDGRCDNLPHDAILTYEEITRVANILAGMGISHIRLTGGEPLVRPKIDVLIRMLKQLNGIDEISMTTNGTLLERWAVLLEKSGLRRVNVSVDSLKPERFREITRGGDLGRVLTGIETARQAGLNPVKVNTVVMPGVNDDEIIDFARWTIDRGANVRFIEQMPFAKGSASVTVADMKTAIETSVGKLEPVREHGSGPANYFRLPLAKGTIGFIQPVSNCFCDNCNRLRLTADGKLRLCLLDDSELDLKPMLRSDLTDDEIRQALQWAIMNKPARHHLSDGIIPEKMMRQIGG